MATSEEAYEEPTSVDEDGVPVATDSGHAWHAVDNVQSTTDGNTLVTDIQDVMGQLEGQLQLQYQEMDTNFLAGNTNLAADRDRGQYVQTPALEEADLILQDTGLVILCGPPGCGKSTTARALLRRCRHQGFKPYTLRCLKEWDGHVGEGRHCVVLLDGILGEVRVDCQQHADWKQIADTARVLMANGTCRIVITAYPHVLHELQLLEKNRKSPLRDSNAVVHLTDALPNAIKRDMLNFHLNPLHLDAEVQHQTVQTVLQNDASGPVFPWCCDYMVDHWSVSEDPATIFLAPAEAYAELFKDMVMDRVHGDIFAAVLALSMRGVFHFLHRLHEAGPHLEELGFDRFSDDRLAVYADILHGSILSEGGFSNRALYEAAGLVLGRFVRFPTLLRVCDIPFLVKYVHMTAVHDDLSQDDPPSVCITVGSVRTCSNDGERCSVNHQSLAGRIYRDITEGNLRTICQHPSLQCSAFLRELEGYCARRAGRMKQLLTAVDSVHQLPLLYWSALHSSHRLTHWCLSRMQDTLQRNEFKSQLLAPKTLALVACSLFDYLTQRSECRLQDFLHETFTAKDFNYPTRIMEFPFPDRNQCLAKEVQNRIETIKDAVSSRVRLQYLRDPSLPVPVSLVNFQMIDEKLQVRIRDRHLWYLMFRLVTDRNMSESDRSGNSVLHIAASKRELSVVSLSLRAGAGITQQNNKGQTPCQLVDEARPLVRKGSGRTGLFEACCYGWADIANLYIELGADVNINVRSPLLEEMGVVLNYENFNHSASPLHYACLRGMISTVRLLIQHQANIAATTVNGDTALHFACQTLFPDVSANIAHLLVQAGANVNARNCWGYTPLHNAAQHGSTDTASVLVRHGANINAQNDLGYTSLLLAVKRGKARMAELLISHGADVNHQNTWGNMFSSLGGKLARKTGWR